MFPVAFGNGYREIGGMGMGRVPTAVGIILLALGFAVTVGIIQVMLEWTLMLGVVVGIVMGVAGGAVLMWGRGITKVIGLGLMTAGVLLIVLALLVQFILRLWFMQWLLAYGGVMLIVLGIALAAVGLVRMCKGNDRGTVLVRPR